MIASKQKYEANLLHSTWLGIFASENRNNDWASVLATLELINGNCQCA